MENLPHMCGYSSNRKKAAHFGAPFLEEKGIILAELDQMKTDYLMVQTARKERDEAKVKAEHARGVLRSAKEALASAEAELKSAETDYKKAVDFEQRVQALPDIDPDMDEFTEDDLTHLNPYIKNLKEAANRLSETKERLTGAEADWTRKKDAYAKALADYTAAQTDLILARKEADRLEKEKRLADLIREKTAKEQIAPKVIVSLEEDLSALFDEIQFVDWTVPQNTGNAIVSTMKLEEKAPSNKTTQRPAGNKTEPRKEIAPNQENHISNNSVMTNNHEDKAGNLWLYGILGGAAVAGAAGAAGAGLSRRKRKNDGK